MESMEEKFLFGGELEGELRDCDGPANDRLGGWRSRIIMSPSICCIHCGGSACSATASVVFEAAFFALYWILAAPSILSSSGTSVIVATPLA
jgi:hypothetical protein